MNVFRLIADICHLLAIVTLLGKIWKTKSCAGISGKTQILFVMVFVTRYVDLMTTYVSLYNTTAKLIFIGLSVATTFSIYMSFRETYDDEHDTFRVEFLLAPATILALLINHEFTFIEIMWAFSIYLESVAILPQLFMIYKIGEADMFTLHYLLVLGSYRAFYILNWIYRYQTTGYYDLISIVGGLVQTAFFCNFFFFSAKPSLRVERIKNLGGCEYLLITPGRRLGFPTPECVRSAISNIGIKEGSFPVVLDAKNIQATDLDANKRAKLLVDDFVQRKQFLLFCNINLNDVLEELQPSEFVHNCAQEDLDLILKKYIGSTILEITKETDNMLDYSLHL
ncbi:PREDICTED: ER lumen protein-retaining receptor-like [Nicrophorus vespilloides]|uniref:ER lumen protein-retaining receptor n=1 Tax=Nicrophorus vespilloides TaxID=110193 RepID=A0ABM1NE03_NICVS|nr:PREDICTED: ER lumen protein-retaining receptor-like [Nicrophorus vespilloides]